MDILEILKTDYQNFPHHQTYRIYAPDVYFKDPMNEFRGRERYQQMIGFIERWFEAPRLDLHQIQRQGSQIRSDWTLHWTTPLPWKPAIAIPGWSELELGVTPEGEEQIISHVDYWHCSRWDVLRQHFGQVKRDEGMRG